MQQHDCPEDANLNFRNVHLFGMGATVITSSFLFHLQDAFADDYALVHGVDMGSCADHGTLFWDFSSTHNFPTENAYPHTVLNTWLNRLGVSRTELEFGRDYGAQEAILLRQLPSATRLAVASKRFPPEIFSDAIRNRYSRPVSKYLLGTVPVRKRGDAVEEILSYITDDQRESQTRLDACAGLLPSPTSSHWNGGGTADEAGEYFASI